MSASSACSRTCGGKPGPRVFHAALFAELRRNVPASEVTTDLQQFKGKVQRSAGG